MGSDGWVKWYPWKGSIEKTLRAAQAAELDAQGYDSREDAFEATGADGTASVLDCEDLTDCAEPAQCWALSAEELETHFGSATPARSDIEDALDALHETLGRGEVVAVTGFSKGSPVAVCFAGWSFD